MKAVEMRINKVTISEYYPQLDQVRFRVHYNDGHEHVLIEQISIKTPEEHSRNWMRQIKENIKKRNIEEDLDDHPLSGTLIINYKQDADAIADKMSRFLKQVSDRIQSAKQNKTSYWDVEKQITSMKLEFK